MSLKLKRKITVYVNMFDGHCWTSHCVLTRLDMKFPKSQLLRNKTIYRAM